MYVRHQPEQEAIQLKDDLAFTADSILLITWSIAMLP